MGTSCFVACLCRLLLETEVIFEARALFVCPLPALYTDLPAPCAQAFFLCYPILILF